MWQLIIASVGGVPKTLVWDCEAAIAPKCKSSDQVAGFAGTLAAGMVIAPTWDPEFTGMTERNNGHLETSFLPGQGFSSPADFTAQRQQWVTRTAHHGVVRSLSGRPCRRVRRRLRGDDAVAAACAGDRAADRSAFAQGLPRAIRWQRLLRRSPCHRPTDSSMTPAQVRAFCEGPLVAEHPRCWDAHLTATDPVHVEVARTLRAPYSRRALRPVELPHGVEVASRTRSDCDSVFGVEFTAPAQKETVA